MSRASSPIAASWEGPMSLAILIFAAASVALLLFGESRGDARLRALAKPAASAAFIAFALAEGALSGGLFGWLILAGLILCALGDVLLIPRRDGLFLAGMGAFAAGHIAYLAAFLTADPSWKSGVVLAAFFMTGASAMTLRAFWGNLGPMRGAVIGYMGVITLMAIASVAATPAAGGYDWRLIAGAFGFAISDISVARDQFGKRAFINRLWGLPLYYGSQLLLASSV